MKRTYIGLLYFFVVSILAPYLLLGVISKEPVTLEKMFVLSFFMSIVTLPFGIIVEMMIVKNNYHNVNTELKKQSVSAKIINKKVHDNSFKAPFFLFPIQPAIWLFAKACEKEEMFYYFEVQIDGVKGLKNVFVNKKLFDAHEEKEQIKLTATDFERKISLCMFEKLVLGEFKDSIFEKYTKYELKSI